MGATGDTQVNKTAKQGAPPTSCLPTKSTRHCHVAVCLSGNLKNGNSRKTQPSRWQCAIGNPGNVATGYGYPNSIPRIDRPRLEPNVVGVTVEAPTVRSTGSTIRVRSTLLCMQLHAESPRPSDHSSSLDPAPRSNYFMRSYIACSKGRPCSHPSCR